MRKCKYTDEQLKEAVQTSYTISNVLKLLGLRPTGGNYDVIKRKIEILRLDKTHFKGKSYLKGLRHSWAKNTPLEEILIENYLGGVSTSGIKRKLIKHGLLNDRCYRCGIKEWQGIQLALELEHKNGNRHDYRIVNLEILCPNCHSLTSTFRGRNNIKSNIIPKEIKIKKPRKKIELDISDDELRNTANNLSLRDMSKKFNIGINTIKNICTRRNIIIPHKSHLTKRFNINKEELESLIATTPYTTIGKMFGVTDNAIRKRARSLGILT